MKSVEQLAQAACEAFWKSLNIKTLHWSEMDQAARTAWIESVQAVRAEIAAVH